MWLEKLSVSVSPTDLTQKCVFMVQMKLLEYFLLRWMKWDNYRSSSRDCAADSVDYQLQQLSVQIYNPLLTKQTGVWFTLSRTSCSFRWDVRETRGREWEEQKRQRERDETPPTVNSTFFCFISPTNTHRLILSFTPAVSLSHRQRPSLRNDFFLLCFPVQTSVCLGFCLQSSTRSSRTAASDQLGVQWPLYFHCLWSLSMTQHNIRDTLCPKVWR